MGVWSRSKTQKDKRTKGLQINRIIGHLPQEGKNKWLYLFSAIELLQFPGWSGRGERNVVGEGEEQMSPNVPLRQLQQMGLYGQCPCVNKNNKSQVETCIQP